MAYKRGQEVFRDPKPFIYVVNPKYCKIVCDCCLKLCENEGILKACATCKWVHYCDQTCQKDAWKSHHKLECKYLQMLNNTKELKELFGGSFQEVLLQLLKTTLKLKNKGHASGSTIVIKLVKKMRGSLTTNWNANIFKC